MFRSTRYLSFVAAVVCTLAVMTTHAPTTRAAGVLDADLAVSISDAPDPVQRGGRITYTVSVTNAGPSTAQAVSVRVTLPPTTSRSLSARGWNCRSTSINGTATVTCTRTSLAAGATAAFTVAIGVGRNLADETVLTGTATVTSSTADPNPANNSATATTTVRGGPSR